MRHRSILLTLVLVAAACGTSPQLPSRDVVRACETLTACGLENDFTACLQEKADPARVVARYGFVTLGPNEIACLAKVGADCTAAGACLNLGAPVTTCSN